MVENGDKDGIDSSDSGGLIFFVNTDIWRANEHGNIFQRSSYGGALRCESTQVTVSVATACATEPILF